MSILTAKLQVYHHMERAEQPFGYEKSFSFESKGEGEFDDRQVYNRIKRLKANTPTEFDLGWVDPKDIAMIIVENLEGKPAKNPSEEEKQQIEQSIVVVRDKTSKQDYVCGIVIPPQGCQQLVLSDFDRFELVAPVEVRIKLVVVPK